MASDNFTMRLPAHLAERLTEQAAETGESKAKIVIAALEAYWGLRTPPSSAVQGNMMQDNTVQGDAVQDILGPLMDRMDRIEESQCRMQAAIQQVMQGSARQDSMKCLALQDDGSEGEETQVSREVLSGLAEGDSRSQLEGLRQVELRERLGKGDQKSALNYPMKKGSEYFAGWTKLLDPEGIAWRWEGEGTQRRFYPIREEGEGVL